MRFRVGRGEDRHAAGLGSGDGAQAVQHGGLAAALEALQADHPVQARKDEPDRLAAMAGSEVQLGLLGTPISWYKYWCFSMLSE